MRHDPAQRRRGLIAINLAAIIFGTAALYGKIPLSPLWIVGLRALFAAVVLAGVARLQHETMPKGRKFWSILGISGVLLALHWLSFFGSVQQGGVAIATLTFASFPLFTVFLEAFLQRRRPYLAEAAAAVAILVAVGLLATPGEQPVDLAGIVLGVFSALTFALFGRISQGIGQKGAAAWVSCWQNLTVVLVIAPVLLVIQPAPPQPADWVWLALLGIVTTALMHQLYFYALQRLSATICSAFVALEPVYAILFAAWFFGEAVTPVLALSGGLILAASLVLLKRDKKTRG